MCVCVSVCLHVGTETLFACATCAHFQTNKKGMFAVGVELINLGAQCQGGGKKPRQITTLLQPYSHILKMSKSSHLKPLLIGLEICS